MNSTFGKDKEILRSIAFEYMQIANLSVHKETINNWTAFHSMKPNKPMLTIYEICWEELAENSQYLKLQCKDKLARELEWNLKKIIYQWKFFPGDMVVLPYYAMTKIVHSTGIGVKSQNQDQSDAQSHLFADFFENPDALNKLHPPVVTYKKAESEEKKAVAESYFGDILPVKLVGLHLWEAFWDRIVFWRGATPVLYDLYDDTELLHELMRISIKYENILVDQYEELNLLRTGDIECHCLETFGDKVPSADFDPEHVKAKDCWVSGAAQIFSDVSPAMHDEFEIQYVKPFFERFGALHYGCCEPLHNKIDIIKKIDNLRAISVSPWADVEKSAEQMGNDYEMARKPNPSFLASSTADYESIRKETRNSIDVCKKYNTPLALLLKDLTTVQGDVNRLTQWCKIVKEEIER